jgi:hypothetical protein
MLDEYIIYNQHFQVVICQICKTGITDDVLLHFQRYHGDILLEIRQAIGAHVNGLNVRSVRDVEIPTGEINAIEGIKIVPGFKCIAESECQKTCGTARSIEKHCRNAHDWNTAKGNANTLIY